MLTFAADNSLPQLLGVTGRDQFLTAGSHAGGYGLPVSLTLATLFSKNPTVECLIAALTVALSAGQMAYFLRLFPWPDSISLRPLAANIKADDSDLLRKLDKIQSADPGVQRAVAAIQKFVGNHDLHGFPSADLAALTAGLASFGLQEQSPFFVLFASTIILFCAYARVKFMPFHTWPQVLGGVVTGVGYAFLAQKFGVIPSGITINFGTCVLYAAFAQQFPKPVLVNLGCFGLFATVFWLLNRLAQ